MPSPELGTRCIFVYCMYATSYDSSIAIALADRTHRQRGTHSGCLDWPSSPPSPSANPPPSHISSFNVPSSFRLLTRAHAGPRHHTCKGAHRSRISTVRGTQKCSVMCVMVCFCVFMFGDHIFFRTCFLLLVLAHVSRFGSSTNQSRS